MFRLDGFALNIGDPTQDYVATTLSYLFGHAAGTNFKLFVSMDLAESAAACAAGSSCCNGVSPSRHRCCERKANICLSSIA